MSDSIWPEVSEQTYSVEDLQNLTYGDDHKAYPATGQGSSTVIQDSSGTILDADAYDRDINVGFTNPNLHRRVDIQDPPEVVPDPNYDPTDPESVDRSYLNQELAPHKIDIAIRGTNSYRTTTYTVHDEESTTTEIP